MIIGQHFWRSCLYIHTILINRQIMEIWALYNSFWRSGAVLYTKRNLRFKQEESILFGRHYIRHANHDFGTALYIRISFWELILTGIITHNCPQLWEPTTILHNYLRSSFWDSYSTAFGRHIIHQHFGTGAHIRLRLAYIPFFRTYNNTANNITPAFCWTLIHTILITHDFILMQ